MSYRNKTYVIFDGDSDMWAYAYMKGWKKNDKIDFNFHDAHDIRPLVRAKKEDYIKGVLRKRMANTKQIILLIGDSTKNLHRFVRWELQIALEKDIPIVAVNLNNLKSQDSTRVPPIIKNEYVIHIPFKLAIIKYALDNFPGEYHRREDSDEGPRYYNDNVYKSLGLE